MSVWAIAAAMFGGLLAMAALTQPIRRPAVAAVAAITYAAMALGAAAQAERLWVTLVVPGALLLGGYWLSGLFFRDPQPWLEAWLLRSDRALAADRWQRALPRVTAELLEIAYAADYVVIGGGAIYVAVIADAAAVASYWDLVLTSELASYVTMPWLRSRPPRALEPPRADGPWLRRVNLAILNNASIQANTLPSGHVAGAVAAAMGVLPVDPLAGGILLAVAMLIAVAAVAGRYHYGVDCAAGAVVPLLVSSLM